MRTYSLYTRPAGASPDGDAVLVREGFSWAAFLLPIPWALWHGLWLTAIVLAIVGAVLGGLAAWLVLDPLSRTVIGLGYGLAVGLSAPDLRRRGLTWRGYAERGIIAGANRAEAEFRYLARREEVLREGAGA